MVAVCTESYFCREDDMLWIFDTINIIYGSQNEKTAPKDVNRYIQVRNVVRMFREHCNKQRNRLTEIKSLDGTCLVVKQPLDS